MQNRGLSSLLVLVIGALVVGALLSLVFTRFVSFASAQSIPVTLPVAQAPAAIAAPATSAGAVAFSPPRLEDAPANIREAVILGASIMTDTTSALQGSVGNKMSCSNCHFAGGATNGGKNGGLSLVGVAATYPQYRSRQNYAVDMVTRINDCMQRSENGKPLPAGSKELTAMLTYFQWIAKGIPIYADVPWLGLPKLASEHTADAAAGTQIYQQTCSPCHGADGSGTAAAPPLWGDNSFNDGAGMATPATMAAFAHLNMPRGNPNLTPEQALDVAAFVDSQPRPKFAGN